MARRRQYVVRVVPRGPARKTAKKGVATPVSRRRIERGLPAPLGATVRDGGVNVAVFSRHATAMTLVLFRPGSDARAEELPLDPTGHRTGDVWHAFVPGLPVGAEYGFRAGGPVNDGEVEIGHAFDPMTVLIDPYARAISGAETWGFERVDEGPAWGAVPPSRHARKRRSRVVDHAFDWGGDRPPGTPLADSVIYEVHVRGFTRHPSAAVDEPGTFAGLIERIPYLKDLGITAVELMPVTEFEERDNRRRHPLSGERLLDYWGYGPISFFAPKASYASDPRGDGPLAEFKQMVRALHRAGIEVILDVVLNHSGEGDEHGTTWSFRGLDNKTYYMLDRGDGSYRDYTGCGNTINANHPVVSDLILEALRYWVTEMHVDGFRFDLASVLTRGVDGSVLETPPLLERIAADPVLANTKLIAEAWDAAGLYQVGTFPHWGRWAEWNGRFRDDVRRFVRGDRGMVPALATRLAGSSDLYEPGGRAPYHGINFVTSHDGFTLADLFSYNERHNEDNGEDNEDGQRENFSWNCSVEGPAASPEITRLRRRLMRNSAALLLTSQGVPMLLAGDEIGRSQRGNNNAYCQDNETSWIDWNLLEKNADLHRFFKLMIAFRRRHPLLRRRTFFANEPPPNSDVDWHGPRPHRPDWSHDSRTLGMHLLGRATDDDVYVMVNSGPEDLRFELPEATGIKRWYRFVDTALASPEEICDERHAPRLHNQDAYQVGARSVVILIGK
jgi:glycogen operon protein